jgi:hypothetical protein
VARALRAADAVLLIAYTLLLAVLLVVAIYFALTADPSHCTAKNSVDAGVGVKFAVLAVVSFAVGRVIGYFRRMIHKAPYKIPKRVTGRVSPVVMYALAGFLLMTGLLLAYETGAVAGVPGWPPITSYVRCAAGHSQPLAGIATVIIFSLLGSWFWYPTE